MSVEEREGWSKGMSCRAFAAIDRGFKAALPDTVKEGGRYGGQGWG